MAGTEARIRIVAADARYTVQFFETGFPQPGDASIDGTFTDSDLDGKDGDPPFAALLEEWQNPAAPVARPRDIGERLYRALDRAGIASAWLKLAATASESRPFRTLIETQGTAAARLPWELCAVPDPNQEFVDFVAFRPHCLFARTHSAPVREDPSRCVRLLIVTGGNILIPATAEAPAVSSEREIAAIVKAFQARDWSVHIEALRSPASRDVLLGTIMDVRPHILHFIGHGDVSPEDAGSAGALIFDEWAWDAQEIRIELAAQDFLRLVYLNACHSGESPKYSAAVARAFMRVGSLAVIAMQAAVTVESAFELTRSFYASLAGGKPVDAAMGDARQAVRKLERAGSLAKRSWGLPMLSVSMPSDRIISLSEYGEPIRKCEVRHEMMITKGPFVDRGAERRAVLKSFHPFVANAPAVRGLLIRDENENTGLTGKSWIAMRVLLELAHAGLEVRSCDLAAGTGVVDYRAVLARLRHGWDGKDSPMYKPLPPEAFTGFDAALARLDEKVQRDNSQTGITADEIKSLFDAFRAGLAVVGKRNGLVLTLDTFTRIGSAGLSPTDFTQKITPQLLMPILDGAIEGVHLILVMRESELGPYGVSDGPDPLASKMVTLSVESFPDAASRVLFHEFCRFATGEVFDAAHKAFDLFYRTPGPRWSPANLGSASDLVQRAVQRQVTEP